TDSSKSDSRRHLRDARARPWLINSVLRGRSTTELSSGLAESKDAPKLSVGIIVTAVPASLSSESVSGSSEKQSGQKPGKGPKAVAKVKALARSAGSKIPVWVGLSCAFSRCSLQASDSEERTTKDTTAAHPKVTKDTPASRLPVRVWRSIAARRPTTWQVRCSNTSGTHVAVSKDKGAGRTQQKLSSAAARNQGSIGKEPLRGSREGVKPRSILKHRAEDQGDAKPAPLTSLGQGVKSEPKKKVMWQEKLITAYLPSPGWPPRAFTCKRCRGIRYWDEGKKKYELHEGSPCWCPEAETEASALQRSLQDWLKDQLALGYDNVSNPVGYCTVAEGELHFEPLIPE
ncbi:uncharacterized protein A1O9_03440, partial [Exophiala aquamarina CBS 119918]